MYTYLYIYIYRDAMYTCVPPNPPLQNMASSGKNDSRTRPDLGFRNGDNARFHQIGATNKDDGIQQTTKGTKSSSSSSSSSSEIV